MGNTFPLANRGGVSPVEESSVVDELCRPAFRSHVGRVPWLRAETGDKNGYKEQGRETLDDRSRGPVRYASKLPEQIASLNVTCKEDKPH